VDVVRQTDPVATTRTNATRKALALSDELRADDVDAGALLFVAGEAEVWRRALELRQSAGPAAGYRIVRRMQHPPGAEPPHLRLFRSGHVSSPSEMPAGRAERKRSTERRSEARVERRAALVVAALEGANRAQRAPPGLLLEVAAELEDVISIRYSCGGGDPGPDATGGTRTLAAPRSARSA
jgi:hypothetical protein